MTCRPCLHSRERPWTGWFAWHYTCSSRVAEVGQWQGARALAGQKRVSLLASPAMVTRCLAPPSGRVAHPRVAVAHRRTAMAERSRWRGSRREKSLTVVPVGGGVCRPACGRRRSYPRRASSWSIAPPVSTRYDRRGIRTMGEGPVGYTVRATNVHGFPMRTVNEPRRDTTNGCNPLGGCQCFKS